ncbi:hypothetical protein BU15DRAFT_64832 [Melanogaster broomeanus]|nr:hypothetical protein BU15DRAFT_64832 [Melanogaster broomeanus]
MSHQCSAVSSAMRNKGLSYAQIATQIGSTEQRVQAICGGQAQPSRTEFDSLARVLGISNSARFVVPMLEEAVNYIILYFGIGYPLGGSGSVYVRELSSALRCHIDPTRI